jgi:hypothetical protein
MSAALATCEVDDSALRADEWCARVREGLESGTLVPYLGPGVTALTGAVVPADLRALGAFFGSKVTLPRWGKRTAWAAAQYIETYRHRRTLVAWMAEAFAAPVAPLPFHRYLASLPLPLIVDTWYDGAMRAALAGRGADADGGGWGEVQGISRAAIREDRWWRAYDASGAPVDKGTPSTWRTVLYKPHGAIVPDKNFLVTDADYVEVLTEIDIQTPLPDVVKARRSALGFVFFGCRFDDQMLRTFARQILKRSSGPYYVVAPPGALTSNERRFLQAQEMILLEHDLAPVLEKLCAPPTAASSASSAPCP